MIGALPETGGAQTAGGPWTLAALLLAGAALARLGIALARRIAPARAAQPTRWRGLDLVVVFAVGLLAQPVAALAFPGEGMLAVLVQTQVVFAAAFLPALLVARRRPPGLAALGLVRAQGVRGACAGALAYALGFPAILGVMAAWSRLADAAGWEPQAAKMIEAFAALGRAELVLALGIAVIVGPFFEELLFRGFLQSFLTQFIGPAGGVIVTALLFALLHGLAEAAPIFLLALLLGWLRLRTQSLAAPWVVHGLSNGWMLFIALSWGVR